MFLKDYMPLQVFNVSGSNCAVKGSLINIENLNFVTLDQDKWGPNYSGTFRESTYGEGGADSREINFEFMSLEF